jgi:hypothetical protein
LSQYCEEIQQEQRGVLVEERLAVVGPISTGARVVQSLKQWLTQIEVLERLQVLLN